jgi:hypothetical protein
MSSTAEFDEINHTLEEAEEEQIWTVDGLKAT